MMSLPANRSATSAEGRKSAFQAHISEPMISRVLPSVDRTDTCMRCGRTIVMGSSTSRWPDLWTVAPLGEPRRPSTPIEAWITTFLRPTLLIPGQDRVGVSYYRTERVPNENTTPSGGFAPGQPGV